MKYIVLLGDGMSDYPIPELNNRTPLTEAKTPHMDLVACKGITGSVRTIPHDFPPGSDVANLSILGYDPARYYTGRAPLEAASMGVELNSVDTAFRCNLVTLRPVGNDMIMEDFSAGHISTEEASQLITGIDKRLGSEDIRFYPGISYRHLMVWKKDSIDLKLIPPHDISGRGIREHLPSGREREEIIRLMNDSQMILSNHKVNKRRAEEGLRQANSIWLWGHGSRPHLPTFKEKYGLSGSVISAVDLLKGMGIYAGLESINVPGATGYLDTDYRGKVRYALSELRKKDFVYLHVEAPDEASHNGNLDDKIRAIEDFDSLVVGEIIKGMQEVGDLRILLMTDHFTPLSIRTHTADPVPFAIYPCSGDPDGVERFDESILKSGSIHLEKGYELMDYFIKEKNLR